MIEVWIIMVYLLDGEVKRIEAPVGEDCERLVEHVLENDPDMKIAYCERRLVKPPKENK